jgi:hypothetical protein
MYCDGVACAVPGNPTLSPGYCGPAQEAAGGYEVYGAGQCGNDQYGACICYLPQHVYQITRDFYIRFPPIVAQTLSEELVQEGPTAACVLRSASG